MRRFHQLKNAGPKIYWAVMRGLSESAGAFTMRDVYARCEGCSLNTVKCYVRACVRAGYVAEIGAQPCPGSTRAPSKLYAVTASAPTSAPFEKPNSPDRRIGYAHQHLWTALRALPAFTTRELAALASTDEVIIGSDTARIFCWKLRQAGYLQDLGRDGRWRVQRLKPGMNTGPIAPAVTGTGAVIDRNPRARSRARGNIT